MSTERRENSYYKHKYRELGKAIDDIKSEIQSNGIKFDSYDYDMIAVLDVLDIINRHIGEGSDDEADN